MFLKESALYHFPQWTDPDPHFAHSRIRNTGLNNFQGRLILFVQWVHSFSNNSMHLESKFFKKCLEGYYYFLIFLIIYVWYVINFSFCFLSNSLLLFFSPILCILIFKCNYYTRDSLMKTSIQ